ncbi:hypothetical protein [Gordonia lacunae]|uniref:SatD family (SatD) n=1 Tax=Gordonia lacunae TaxID=417102 RepID=A0A243QAF1_9ACTN|nr:hypothetical protein [Gordonia lacunae]OUC78694.1 hypothetical protein CA982_11565 [Gordonia lacunae]
MSSTNSKEQYFVITADQKNSRSAPDRVDELISTLDSSVPTVRPFERTAGDEFQAVLDDPMALASLAVEICSDGHWSVGIGVGPVELPLPSSTRACRGPAFASARTAVEAAKRQRIPLCVHGPDIRWCHHAQTAARLITNIIATRSAAGVEAVTLIRQGFSQVEAAGSLGITPQAMSQRLRAAGWDLESDTLDLVGDCLSASAGRNRR